MKAFWLLVYLIACSGLSWAIYGPSLTRTNIATAARACEDADLPHGDQIEQALRSEDPNKIVQVLGGALEDLRSTRFTDERYPARQFCIHELVPAKLPREGEIASAEALKPTTLVKQYQDLGVEYFYYTPDAEWTLQKNPVDLNILASGYMDSPWGRQAFLMMTRLGWSQGACQEGSDQFREVIKHSEQFLFEHPDTEISDDIRLELAHAYATWWNVSREERNPPYIYPEMYTVGASEAKQRAIELYQQYLKTQKQPTPAVQKQLKRLQQDPKGSGESDYFCADYED